MSSLDVITTLDDLSEKISLKYFPLTKTAILHNETLSFLQFDDECLFEALVRFKEL